MTVPSSLVRLLDAAVSLNKARGTNAHALLGRGHAVLIDISELEARVERCFDNVSGDIFSQFPVQAKRVLALI